MRRFRLDRLVAELHARDLGGLLLFDPLNIRYATDSTNMQVWNAHNPFRACLVCPDGHLVLWDYKHAPFLAAHNPLVAELRSGAAFIYSLTGEATDAAAAAFAAEVADLLRTHAGNRRLAVDKIMLAGFRALTAAGLTVEDGEPATEHARAIKGPDDIRAMRCALHACEAAMAEMRAAARPGLSEDEIWAHLHAGNIRRGGEWIETRLLTSGPRTNPWFQECGPRIVQPNEILAFDTDLIGPYGMCADISRTWWIGDAPARPDMRADYALALRADRLEHRAAPARHQLRRAARPRLRPPRALPRPALLLHLARRRPLPTSGPTSSTPTTACPGAFEGTLEPGMTLCVESLITREGADFSIKLEEQVLITETGPETLSRATPSTPPWPRLEAPRPFP